MQFLTMVISDPDLTTAPTESDLAATEAWDRDRRQRGELGAVGRLADGAGATTVRVRRAGGTDQLVVTDGPYAEAHELIGGFGIIEAADLEAAIAIAATDPAAGHCRLDVRAFDGDGAAAVPPLPDWDAPDRHYLLFVCVDRDPDRDAAPLPPGTATPLAEPEMDVEDWVAEMDGRGLRLLGEVLAPADQTVSVAVREGRTLRTDGPFAEAHELIAGIDLLRCPDLDVAIEVARRHPMARHGAIELRPLRPLRDA